MASTECSLFITQYRHFNPSAIDTCRCWIPALQRHHSTQPLVPKSASFLMHTSLRKRPYCRYLAVAVVILIIAAPTHGQYLDTFEIEKKLARRLMKAQLFDFAELQLDLMAPKFKAEGVPMHILYGRLYSKQGQRTKALNCFSKVPANHLWYLNTLLEMVSVATDSRQKQKYYQQYFDQNQTTPTTRDEIENFKTACLRYADLLRRDGKPNEAENILKRLGQLPPEEKVEPSMVEFVAAQTVLAAADQMVRQGKPRSAYDGKVKQALEQLNKLAWSMTGISAKTYPEIAHAHILLGDFDAAIKILDTGLRAMRDLERHLKETTRSVAGSPLAAAFYYLGEGFARKAQAAKAGNDMADARKNFSEAIKWYFKVADEYDGAPLSSPAMANVLKVKDELEALGVPEGNFEKIFGSREKQQKNRLEGAHDLYRAEEYEKAVKLYVQVAQMNRRSRLVPEALFFGTVSYYKTGKFLEAMALADFLVESFRNAEYTRKAVYNLAIRLREKGSEMKAAGNAALADAYMEDSNRVLATFVQIAPKHPKAASSAYRVAEGEFAKGNALSKRKRQAARRRGASTADINKLIREMRQQYLKAAPLYQILIDNYGTSREGLEALYKLGWIYHICDDIRAADYFIRFCEVNEKPDIKRLDAKFLAADRFMRAERINDAIENFTEFLDWCAPGGVYDQTVKVKKYRENAEGYLAWSYDMKAAELFEDADALGMPASIPVPDQGGEVPAADGGDVESPLPETSSDAAPGDVETATEPDATAAQAHSSDRESSSAGAGQPMTAEELEERREALRNEARKFKGKGLRAFEAFVNKYPASEQAPNNMAKLGSLYVQRGDYDKGSMWLGKLQQNYPASSSAKDARFTVGRAYCEIKDWDRASDAFRELIPDMRNYALGNISFIADRLYDKVDAQTPALDPAVVAAANSEIIRRAGDWANPDHAKAVTKREKALFQQARAYVAMKRADDAIALYDQVREETERKNAERRARGEKIRESGYYFDVLFGKGEAHRAAGRLDEAQRSFDEILTYIDPRKYPGVYYRAILESGKTMAAATEGETVRKSVARFMQILNFAEASNAEVMPSIEGAYFHAATALSLIGETEKADEYRKNYLAKFPRGSFRKEIQSLPTQQFFRTAPAPAP